MKKIINYILNGQGLGARLLMLFTAIAVIIAAVYLRIGASYLVPYAQDVADQMLPIKISNGVVVEPSETYKAAAIQSGAYSMSLPLVIDTRVDNLNTAGLKDGVYLTRTMLYTVSDNEVKMLKLTNDMDIPQGDYTGFFKSVLNWAAVFGALFGWAFMFIFYFILSLFFSWLAVAVAAIAGRKYTFDQRMRLSVLSLIGTYLVSWLLSRLGLSSGMLAFFLIAVIFEGLIISRLPAPASADGNSKNDTKTDENMPEAINAESSRENKAGQVTEKVTAAAPVKAKAKTGAVSKDTAKAPTKKKAVRSSKKTEK